MCARIALIVLLAACTPCIGAAAPKRVQISTAVASVDGYTGQVQVTLSSIVTPSRVEYWISLANGEESVTMPLATAIATRKAVAAAKAAGYEAAADGVSVYAVKVQGQTVVCIRRERAGGQRIAVDLDGAPPLAQAMAAAEQMAEWFKPRLEEMRRSMGGQ